MGDADGGLGLTYEGNDDAMTVDALHLALDAFEGAGDDAHPAVNLVDEVVVGQGYALAERVGTGGRMDEVLHLTVGDPDDLPCLVDGARRDGHELQLAALGVETLQELQLNLHGVDEDDVIDGTVLRTLTHLTESVAWQFLDMEEAVVALGTQLGGQALGPHLLGIVDVHRIPPVKGIILFFQDRSIEMLVDGETKRVLLLHESGHQGIRMAKNRCARVHDTRLQWANSCFYHSTNLLRLSTAAKVLNHKNFYDEATFRLAGCEPSSVLLSIGRRTTCCRNADTLGKSAAKVILFF